MIAGKFMAKAFVFIMIALTIYIIYIGIEAAFDGQEIPPEFFGSLIAFFVFGLFSFWFIYLWSNIETNEEGLFVEFVWGKLFVPWDDIITIKRTKQQIFKVWLMQTKNSSLTKFHILYSIQYGFGLKPGIAIHAQLPKYNSLLKEIKKNIK